MKTFLMFENEESSSRTKVPENEAELKQDLELNILCHVMSAGDEFIFENAMKAILSGLYNDVNTILYRQDILKDCLKNSSLIREIYALLVATIENKKKHWYLFLRHPSSILSDSIEVIHIFIPVLKQLKNMADEHSGSFESNGFYRFFEMLKKELTNDYLQKVENCLQELKFRGGILIGAELGAGNKGVNYVLRKPPRKFGWFQRLFNFNGTDYSFTISPRDESGAIALSEIADEGMNSVANVLAQASEHILNFFNTLQSEISFYMGCLNLYENLQNMGVPRSFPIPTAANLRTHSFKELCDVCLVLSMGKKVIGNDLNADNKNLVLITGANQGGKSTYLRSIGLSQLMMQCGMFVTAHYFSANICNSLFTHYRREEDPTMKSGKLDEELNRMNYIADHLTSNSLLLFNESFAATNEREGSEIAKQIVTALLEKSCKVFFVTHLYEFAHGLYHSGIINSIYLVAQREIDGRRSFKLIEGQPSQTSYGGDVYKQIFG